MKFRARLIALGALARVHPQLSPERLPGGGMPAVLPDRGWLMRPFDELLQEELARVEEPVHELVVHAPALYRLMANILDDPSLPGRLRPLVLGTVAYFVLSTDIMSESLRGIDGYADDVFLTAFVANRVLQETGSETALTENWDGDVPLLPLLTEILAREIELIGDRRDLILWYIGYEYTQPGSAG